MMYSNSTLNITAVMMTAASVALGMKAQAGMRTTRARMTMRPVKTPPAVVFTPLALLTAVREKEPVVGYAWKKLAAKLHNPSAIISWLASTCFPPAENKLDWTWMLHCLEDLSHSLTKCLGNCDVLQDCDDWNDNDGRV